MGPKVVLFRTYSAGVHFGEIVSVSQDGKRVDLRNARRIWSWCGANTLNEIALHGVGPGSKISETVPEITLTEVIEQIPCQPEAVENLNKAGWGHG